MRKKTIRKGHTCIFGKTLDDRYLKCYSCDKIKKVNENNTRQPTIHTNDKIR